MKVAIFMEDGIINDIIADGELELVFIDRDTEGCMDEEVLAVDGADAYVIERTAYVDADALEKIYEQTIEQHKSEEE